MLRIKNISMHLVYITPLKLKKWLSWNIYDHNQDAYNGPSIQKSLVFNYYEYY